MNDCIFCKIVNGEIPCNKVYEDDDFLAFLDNYPVNKGHVLVIPKKHFRWVYDVDKHGEYWNVAKKIVGAQLKAFEPTFVHYITWGEIPHAHIHVIPRYADDGHPGFIDFKLKKKFSDKEMKEIAEKITSFL